MTDKKSTPSRLRESWEYKSILFILRFFVAGFVLIYALIALPAIWSWAQVWYFRQQPPEHFVVLLKEAEKSGDFRHALRWLGARPPAEISVYLPDIEQDAGQLPPQFFNFNLAEARRRQDNDGAIFWLAYQRYRQRFDLLRCGGQAAFDRGQVMAQLVEHFIHGPDEMAVLSNDPKKLAPVLEKVLAFDADHPAANDPRLTCQVVAQSLGDDYTPEPQENWERIRYVLRLKTDQAIHDMRTGKIPATGKATK